MVECCVRKPCCVGDKGRELLSSGSRRRSRTLMDGERRDMGRYPDPKSVGLPGFGIGIMVARFQMEGMSALL